MSEGHSHAVPVGGSERALWAALGLTSFFLVTEVIALTTHVVHAQSTGGTPLIERIEETLADRFALFHTAIQLGSIPCAHSAAGCNVVDKRHHENDRSSDKVSLKKAYR